MLAFVAQRGGLLAMAVISHASPLLIAGLVLQIAAGLFAAIAIWVGRHMQGSLIALGVTVVLAAGLQIAALGSVAVPGALAQTAGAFIAIGGLIFLLRHIPEGE
jgi:hypothetical protein